MSVHSNGQKSRRVGLSHPSALVAVAFSGMKVGLALGTGTMLCSAAQAAVVLGSYANAIAVHPGSAPVQSYEINSDKTLASAAVATASNAMQSKAITDAWRARVSVAGSGTDGLMFGSAGSTFAVNQLLTGARETASVTYRFSFDGSFAPGDPDLYPEPNVAFNIPEQNFGIFLIAWYGRALSLDEVSDEHGIDWRFTASTGEISLARIAGSPGYVDTLTPHIIPGAFYFSCTGGDLRCRNGGTFNDLASITFDAPVGQDYFVSVFAAGATNGLIDFFNTIELESISVPNDVELFSDDDGALVRNADGTYGLAAAVPEPATWLLLIAGFGLLGGALRRATSSKISLGVI